MCSNVLNSRVIVIKYLYSVSSTNGFRHAFGFPNLAARDWGAPDPALHSGMGCSLPNKLYQVLDRQGDPSLVKIDLLSMWVRGKGHLSWARLPITQIIHFKCPSPTPQSHAVASQEIFHSVTDLHVPSYWSPKKPVLRLLTSRKEHDSR